MILICRSKYMKNVYPVFTLNGKIVDESDTARYIGHIICNSAVAQLVECRTRNRESPGSNPL